ncbi:hypothetical protein SALBM311S_02280 [Streptomyces alboniger]
MWGAVQLRHPCQHPPAAFPYAWESVRRVQQLDPARPALPFECRGRRPQRVGVAPSASLAGAHFTGPLPLSWDELAGSVPPGRAGVPVFSPPVGSRGQIVSARRDRGRPRRAMTGEARCLWRAQGRRRLASARHPSCKVVTESSAILIGAEPVGLHGRAEPPTTLGDLDSLALDSVRICGQTDASAFLGCLLPSWSAHHRGTGLLSSAGQARDWLAPDRLRDWSGLSLADRRLRHAAGAD